MFTSYDSSWLGDPRSAPVFEELNRRKSIVYTHPSEPLCCSNLLPQFEPRIGGAVIGYGTDTTRTIASYLFTGTARRYPDLRMVFSHAGGTMPFLIERFQNQSKLPGAADQPPPGRPRRGARPLFLRHGANLEPGRHESADGCRAGQPGGLRHRLPVPHQP